MNLFHPSTEVSNLVNNHNRLQLYYTSIICQDLLLKENYPTIFKIPYLEKIVLHLTSHQYGIEKKNLLAPLFALEFMTHQKSKVTRVKKSLASFKIRKNQVIGCKVTLRGNRMYTFLNLFISTALPRLDNFSGFSKRSLNTVGNVSLGFSNILIFPQLEEHFEHFQNIQGLNMNVSLKHSRLDTSRLLYSAFQLPFL